MVTGASGWPAALGMGSGGHCQRREESGRLTGTVLVVLSLVGIEGLHVVVELLLTGLFDPDLGSRGSREINRPEIAIN